jgi:putative sterol carrier protein
VAEFLSESWVAEMDRAARDAPALAAVGAAEALVVEQRVRRGDDLVVYHLAFASDGTRVRVGPATTPDLVLITDAATARGLQLGTVNAEQAAMAGRLKIRGQIGRLRAAGEALRSMDDVFRAVRDATTYPAESDRGEGHR